MSKIFKYIIERKCEQLINIPNGFKILTAQVQHVQHGKICIWAEVEEGDLVSLPIYILGTGHTVDIPYVTYIATVQDVGYAWHIYHGEPYKTEKGGKDE